MDLFNWLESQSWELGSLIIVAVFVIYAILGIILIRKIIDVNVLKSHHDVAGYIFATLGVLYSVLLGFTVVNVQQRFDKIKNTTHVEASILSQLYRDSEVFSDENGGAVRKSIDNYIKSVIQVEWPLMAEAKDSPETEEALNDIWKVYYKFSFEDRKQQVWYSESIHKLNQLVSARLDRLMGSTESLSREMWTSLILGGLLVISFTWFFGLENLTAHILMASMLAAATAFLLFLIYSLDTTFSGGVNIGPEAYENILTKLPNVLG